MMNPKSPVDRAAAAPLVKEASQGWRATAIAAAVAASLCWTAPPAHALSLGRITVLSALGEPLVAEIELPDISAEESSTLQTSIAAPEAFRAAGLEYSPALRSIRIAQQRRPNGRSVLRLTSDQAVSDPFVDLILQVNWASGRIVRDYTLLLDPPRQRTAPPPAVTAPQVSPPSAAAPPSQSSTPPPTPAPAPAPQAQARPGNTPPPAAPPVPPAGTSAAPVAPATSGTVTVRPGDTASRIATANKPPRISLDQMLVALLRSNPEAFVQGNVNRLKAGSVLDLPTPEQASTVPAPEASRLVTAQSRDFNAFRSRFAATVPAVQTDSAERSASGRIQTQIDENRAGAGTPDKLTLSKGGVQARAAEERIAREKAATEASERVAELSRNISDLNRLGAASAPAAAGAPATAPAAAPSAGTAPPAGTGAAPSAAAPASAPSEGATPTASAPAAPMPGATNPGWLDDLASNRLVLLAAAALIALLVALGLHRARQRRKAEAAGDAAATSSQPDSFFSTSGGQQVDTTEIVESSMVYSPSQLDAASDVDPVAEADVYLAYGRDLQAEEILKEALRTNPTRVAIHAKLADIYAKRRDTPAFLAVAAQAHALTAGAGPEWLHIAELGRELVPEDPLWNAPSHAAASTAAVAAAAGLAGATAVAAASNDPANSAPAHRAASPLPAPQEADASLDDTAVSFEPAAASGAAAPNEAAAPAGALPPIDFDLDLDLDLDPATLPAEHGRAQADADSEYLTDLDMLPGETAEDVRPSVAPPPLANALDFDLDLGPGSSSAAASPASLSTPPARETAASDPDHGALAFDIGSLSLDLGDSTERAISPPEAEFGIDDPLTTKLALAEEFNAIGDADGARALAEEVLAEASGPLKAQAQRFLDELS